MRYEVSDLCIGCGLCTELSPDVFHLTDQGVAKAVEEDVPAAFSDTAEQAMDSCPANAIHETT